MQEHTNTPIAEIYSIDVSLERKDIAFEDVVRVHGGDTDLDLISRV